MTEPFVCIWILTEKSSVRIGQLGNIELTHLGDKWRLGQETGHSSIGIGDRRFWMLAIKNAYLVLTHQALFFKIAK
jgi:hypothetical protein